MFAHLEEFKSKDFWEEHKIITFNTLTEKNEYEILAVFKTVVYTDSPDSFKYYHFTNADTPEEFTAFVDQCKELSLYDTRVSAEYGDKLITLSTREYSRTNVTCYSSEKNISSGTGGGKKINNCGECTLIGCAKAWF